jgi:hypothetical protein
LPEDCLSSKENNLRCNEKWGGLESMQGRNDSVRHGNCPWICCAAGASRNSHFA